MAVSKVLTNALTQLTSGVVYLASNVSLGATGTFTDVLSTPTLPAGRYLVDVKLSVSETTGAAPIITRLVDSSGTFYDTSNYVNTTGGGSRAQNIISTVVTLASSTILKAQAADFATSTGVAVANQNSNPSARDSSMRWVRLD